MLSCKETTWVCSNELDRPLRLGERVSLHLHLMMCSGCTNYREQLATLQHVMKAYADGQAPLADSSQEPAQGN